jgi:hypothetical protein
MSYPENFVETTYGEPDDEMVTCDNCGNCWDGYAQCSCHGIPMVDELEPDKVIPANNSEPTHTMTLRSHSFGMKFIVEETDQELIHPDCWNAIGHYGQCGQSCPCCRAEVGDVWGACLVCSKK